MDGNPHVRTTSAAPRTVQERAARRRKRAMLRREAERRIAAMDRVSTGSAFHSPKVLGLAFLLLAIIGAVLVHKLDFSIENNRPIPHLSALKSVDVLATALGRYRFHTGEWPTPETGLRALQADPGVKGWLGPYLVELHPDPWGTPYFYELTNGFPVVLSCGPDLKPHTADDLRAESTAYDPGTAWTNGWVPAEQRLQNPADVFE